MEFRPCIDIHNGKVKQIVGGSLEDGADQAAENFVAQQDAAFFAKLYQNRKLAGGHVILLNPASSRYYEETKAQALCALRAYPGGLQIGGGIVPENAAEFLAAGASHVIVTSYVFSDGLVHLDRLKKICAAVKKEKLVLDVSCRKMDGEYRVVTDRWQKVTRERVTKELLDALAEYCDEFLVHAVDVEGKAEGIELELVRLLGDWGKIPITYAGGVHNFHDLQLLREAGRNRLNVTIGSALDLFGGNMELDQILSFIKEEN